MLCLAPSAFASALSQEAVSTSPAELKTSSFTLPRRSDIISILLHHHRHLRAENKFASLNKVFSEISLKFPDANVEKSGIDLTITQLVCRNLNVRDIQLSHNADSSTSQTLDIDATGLKLDCTFRWEYKWSFFNGSGSGSAKLDPSSSASIDLKFISENYETHPPHDVSIPDCNANVQIEDMDFDGDGLGFIGGIINAFEGLLRDTVEEELSSTVCSELRGLGDDALDDLLLKLSDQIDNYLEPLEASLADPLQVENTIELPTIDNGEGIGEPLYINFQELGEYAGDWINSALEQVNSFLGTSETDAFGNLGINTFIRENFLNNEGKLVLDPSMISSSGNIFEGHDMLTETTISIQSIEIEGLDSFNGMDLLNFIGKHTFQNKLKLDYLFFKLDMEAVMKASSKSDAVIVAPNSPPITEQFTIDVAVMGIEIDVSFFIGVNTQSLGNLELGSLLHSQNILSCLLSAVDDARLTGLSISVSDIVPPNLSGFIDAGIDHLISTGADALFEMYENVLIKAMPNFFGKYVRDMANDFIEDALVHRFRCPTNDGVEAHKYIDFRDMLLPSAEAKVLGGSGDGHYGNVAPWVMNIVEDQLFAADENGLLAINDMLITPLTKSLSGVEGALKMNGTLFQFNETTQDIWTAFADNLRLTLSNLTVAGLDTLRSPVKVFRPKSLNTHLLENQLNLGIPSKPLDASIQFEIEVGDATSPLATNNVMDLQLSMPTMEVLFVLLATVQKSRFMKFPLKDILNFSCWLSMIPVSDKSSTIDVGLAMHSLDVLLEGINAKTACVSCSNSWLEDFNSILDFLDKNQFISGLKTRALEIVSDIMQGDWVQGMVDKQITAASHRCPHDPAFGRLLSGQVHPPFTGTRTLVDGILYAAFPLAQVIAVVLAQKHSDLDIALPAEIELDVPEGANLIDLTDLSSIAGWADMALEEARSYLGGKGESGELGITTLMKTVVLDDNGFLTIPFEEKGFKAGGVELSLYNVTLIGLDSFTLFDVLKANGSNKFGNSVNLQRLGVTLEMGLSVENSILVDDDQMETVTVSLILKDVSVDASLLMALDQDLMGDLKLGSIQIPSTYSLASSEERMLVDNNEMETITVSLILEDVSVDVSLLMALDQDLMGDLKLGSILNTKHIFSCLLSTIHSVGLSEFLMDIGDIEEFSISGFISEETNESVQSITEAIFGEYKTMVLETIPAFTSTTIRPILHGILQALVDTARDDGECPEPDGSLDGILDFRDLFLSEERSLELLGQGDSPYGDLFRLLYNLLENLMSESDENGLSKMNTLLASLTEHQSSEGGELYYPGELFRQDMDIALGGLNAAIELGVFDVRVSNIDSLGAPIKLLQPVKGEASAIDNNASIGVGSDPLRAEIRLLIKGKGNEIEVHNELVLGLSLKDVSMMLEVLAQITEQPFLNFPLQDIMNLQCWLATVVSPVLDKYGLRAGDSDTGIIMKNLALAVAEARLHVECVSCSSPLIEEMASKLGSQGAVEDTTAVANMIFDYISNLLGGDFVQSELDKMLKEAAMKCPHSPSYNKNFAGLKYDDLVAPEKSEDPYGFLIAIISVIAACAVIAAVITFVTRCVSRRRHNRWVQTLSTTQKLELEKMQNSESEMEKDLNNRMSSLVRSKEVPLFLRLFIPIVILGNIALFLSGHLSLGGTVKISGSFAGQDFDVDGFFEFSMAKSTIEMWNAGAKSLAILIVIFSGVWPYSKLIITLFIWFAPPRWLSSKRRGKILRWLDVLGKWSMVDVFVLLMTLASFRLSVESPDHLNFLPEDLYSINMLVVPLWGLYANMLAQLVAQISSHIIIHYHRKTVMAAAHSQEELNQLADWDLAPSNSDNTQEKLRDHKFKLEYEASSMHAVLRRSVHWILSAAMLSLVVLVICGCALPSFSIEVLGLVGLAVESGNEFEQANVLYSVFDLASMIMDQARYLNTAKDFVGLGTLSSLLVITVFIVPLAQAASLLTEWFAPMTKKHRMRNTVLNEILSAWQYMEVYVLSIIIAAWQLGGVSEYMINAYCDPLKDTFASLSYHGILSEDDAQCFRVNATVESASWILVVASLILCILNHFVMGASSQKAQDDEIPAERRLYSDRWLHSKQSNVTIGVDMSMSLSADEGEGSQNSDSSEKVCLSPVKPRFTDYYFFVTKRQTEKQNQSYEAETALHIEIDEERNSG
eukprot:CAMPEP_0183743138 /NCGR_PEP_ID=MMETSP0737-20130205/65061_1 /TAXON_ID=385413 /ORGANISM="Thalassiosira miniscula, Strain CCMP1093" /LENGTH=2172 /DNA_ID=CAMNT_0025978745 /DNA_START=179 /DNA_END=6698 /DNA_ORIENTATION=+